MSEEHRRDVRYRSSQKAVLLNKGASGSLCVITNLSNRGLCVAMVGSTAPARRERIDLKVNKGTVLCNIVNRGKEGLHCRFDDQMDTPDFWKHFSMQPAGVADMEKVPLPAQFLALMPPSSSGRHAYDMNGMWQSSSLVAGHYQHSYNLTRIYSEGCFVGREQIDATVDDMGMTADVLNPYHGAEEKERWALGFMDAIRHMAKHYSPFR